MKTTLVLRDDLYRRAKARAALLGRPMSRYLEECLEKALAEEEPNPNSFADWAPSLPKVSDRALADLQAAMTASDFREIDPGMWR